MQDFGEGTSSRSTKLVHGGLRYLKQREFKLVKEVGRERTIVSHNAPHITYPTKVLVPIYKDGSIGKFMGKIAMVMYDWLAKVKKEDRHSMLSIKDTLKKEPMLRKEGLKGAIYYTEYRTNDARLTLEIVKKAHDLGAIVLNKAKVTDFLYNDKKRVNGVLVNDLVTGTSMNVSGKYVINATGPWVDHLCYLDGSKKKKLVLTKGVHVVIDQEKLPIKSANYFDVPGGRMVFALPNGNKSYVGTTDTIYEGDMSSPSVTKADAEYLVEAVKNIYPNANITIDDIESSWSGLRPLIKQKGASSPSEISRKDETFISSSGLLSIAGGKLTGYRKMAEKATEFAVKYLHHNFGIASPACTTDKTKLSGGDFDQPSDFDHFLKDHLHKSEAYGISKDEVEFVVRNFGSNSTLIFDQMKNTLEASQTFGLPNLEMSMLQYCVDYEAMSSVSDFFIRRVPYLYFDIEKAKKLALPTANYLQTLFKWTDEHKDHQLEEFHRFVSEASIFH